jgi:predicted phosphodiesterase
MQLSVSGRKRPDCLALGLLLVLIIAASGLIIAAAGMPFGAGADPSTAGAVYPNLNITPGSDQSQLCFSWETANPLTISSSAVPMVQIAAASAMTGATFPASQAQTFYGQSIKAYFQNGTTAGTVFAGWYQNKVTVTGLSPGTAYVYRYGNGAAPGWSGVSTLHTGNPDDFELLAVADPQIGTYSVPNDQAGWQNTVARAVQAFPGASFMLCAGDQVNSSTQSEEDNEYAAYFSPPQLQQLPVAVIEGDHDYFVGAYYGDHYNQPNLTADGATRWGNDGDYWFTYGNALFMMLDSNALGATTQDEFIGRAVAANPDAEWRIVCLHHSIYSEAAHCNDPDVRLRRLTYPSFLDKYQIDVVISGHDHSYTRTHQMLGGAPQQAQTGNNGDLLDPAGAVYFTLDSASGSKYYDFTVPEQAYSAFRWQHYVPTFSHLVIAGDKFSITTYRTDNMSAIDSYSIFKSAARKGVESSSSPLAAPAREQGPIRIVDANGKAILADPPPIIDDGHTLVPLYALARTLEAGLTWDAAQKVAILTTGKDEILFPVDSDQATENGRPLPLGGPDLIAGGRMYVPLKAVAEALGEQITWDGENRTIKLD